jgi:hypothetical protein
MRIAKASSGTAKPMPTPIPMLVQSLFAPGWASAAAAAAAVVEVVSTVVDVLVVDSSVLLSVVVTTGLAFVTTAERVDDELDGDELGEFDDETDDDVEEVDEGPELELFEEEDVEVVDSVEEDEEVTLELVVDVAAADTVTAAPKFQLLARNNELLLLQHCEPSSTQQ